MTLAASALKPIADEFCFKFLVRFENSEFFKIQTQVSLSEAVDYGGGMQ